MCQAFFKEHHRCTCIYIPAIFAPCPAFILANSEAICERPTVPTDPFADPEDTSTETNPFADPEDPFADPEPFVNPEDASANPSPKGTFLGQAPRSKLLTYTHSRLGLTYGDTDFVSVDVDDSRAPNGVKCTEGIISRLVYRAGDENRKCPLCDKPDVMNIVQGIEKWEKERKGTEVGKGKDKVKEKESEKGIFNKTAQIGTAAVKLLKSAASSKAKKQENNSKGYSIIGEEKSSVDKRAEKKEKKPAGPRDSMYVDNWGNPITPWC